MIHLQQAHDSFGHSARYGAMKLLALFFLSWVAPTCLFFHLPLPENISSLQLNLTLYFFIGFYLFLASSLSFRVINHAVVMSSRAQYLLGFTVLIILYGIFWFGGTAKHVDIFLTGVSTAGLLFGGTLLGAALSVAIKRIGELVPVCLTAAAADFTSVVRGPTKKMAEDLSLYYQEGMEGPPPLVDSILIKAGVPGYEIPIPLFGVSDWILLILLSTALIRLEKSDNLLLTFEVKGRHLFFPVTTLALYLSLVTAQVTHHFLPAMVFICVLFLAFLVCRYNLLRELKRSDIIYSLIFPGMASVMILYLSR